MSGRIYSVSITIITLVQADDEKHAVRIAKEEFREIAGDTIPLDIDVGVMAEITAVTGLPRGWDGQCLPYGGDGKTRLGKILLVRAP